ncbi:heavy metal-binding domain-containing protein [Flavobacterium sp.]|uniref:heavy metal-binding domain-containing protein n=1 Tax=Flavobacterium sp. TaxID=239 RepID=UPI0040488041
MKKTIVMMMFALATLSMVSCKEEDKKVEGTETTDEHAGHDHTAGEDMHHAHAHYVCPMDCEKGKEYEEKGKCGVCEMDLVEAKAANEGHDHSEEGHEGHNH